MEIKKFTRNKEDFVCENCGAEVLGTGYTNHCPKCLYSKHVDINPGDRAGECQGMMEPIGAEVDGDISYIMLKCSKCEHKRRNKLAENDNFELFLEISKKQAENS